MLCKNAYNNITSQQWHFLKPEMMSQTTISSFSQSQQEKGICCSISRQASVMCIVVNKDVAMCYSTPLYIHKVKMPSNTNMETIICCISNINNSYFLSGRKLYNFVYLKTEPYFLPSRKLELFWHYRYTLVNKIYLKNASLSPLIWILNVFYLTASMALLVFNLEFS